MLDLNIGQVQAVIEGYNERLLDGTIQAIWTGYYSAYYSGSKHPKKPTELIRKIVEDSHKSTRGNTSGQDVDMNAEIEMFAQRDLRRLSARKET